MFLDVVYASGIFSQYFDFSQDFFDSQKTKRQKKKNEIIYAEMFKEHFDEFISMSTHERSLHDMPWCNHLVLLCYCNVIRVSSATFVPIHCTIHTSLKEFIYAFFFAFNFGFVRWNQSFFHPLFY